MKPERIKLRLILDVDYELNGVTPTDAMAMLKNIAHRAADDGLMTFDTASTVESWDAHIEVRE